MEGQGTLSTKAEIAAVHIGNLSIAFDGLSVNVASWSIAASAITVLVVFLGRIVTQWWRIRRQDHGIIARLQAQLEMFHPVHKGWQAKSDHLRGEWEKDPAFRPFTRITARIDRPFDRHHDRLPLILPIQTYKSLVRFYEDDRSLDDAHAALVVPEFIALEVERRLRWLEFLDTLAKGQADLCAVLVDELKRRPQPIWRSVFTAGPGTRRGRAVSSSNDRADGR